MMILGKTVISAAAILLVASLVCAQEQNTFNSSSASRRSAATITAAAAADRVRFTAPSSVVQIRLEVYNANGEKVFDNEIRGGNVVDWLLQNGQAERLSDGYYLCVVTGKSLSGRISQRVGSVTVLNATASVEVVDSAHLTAKQAQAVGPLEEDAAMMVLRDDQNQTGTVIAHNGTEGQVTRGRGARSFRLGDFFTGTDKEQMRLTEEGNLGIGTSDPRVKLDVAGMIGAREGVMFSDGSSLSVNRRGALMRTSASGDVSINVAGTGAAGRLTKWTDGSGTLGDSLISESGSNIIHNGSNFQMTAAASPSIDTNLIFLNATDRTTGILAGSTASYSSTNGPFFAMRGNTYTTIAGQRGIFTISAGSVSSPTGTEGSIKFNSGNDQVQMVIKPNGNIGIGTTDPTFKLHLIDLSNTGLRVQTNTMAGTVASFGGFGEFQIDAQGVIGGRFTVRENGNAGIGTASPLYKLHVSTGSGENLVFGPFTDTVGGFLPGMAIQSINDADSAYNPLILEGSQVILNAAVSGPSGNVGIGTFSPHAKLHVAGGHLYIANPNSLIMSSPNGACWLITVNNAGALTTVPFPCP